LQGNDELRGILNSGYTRKTAYVVRVSSHAQVAPKRSEGGLPAPTLHNSNTPSSTVHDPSSNNPPIHQSINPTSTSPPLHHSRTPSSTLSTFSCWCPKAIAAIGRLPDTLADRCIVLRMQRKTAKETSERLRQLDAAGLRNQCARFVLDHAEAIANAQPEIPSALNDRAADIWEPLFALADLAGPRWSGLARQAAVGLTANAQDHNPIGSLLLDIFLLFNLQQTDRLFTRTLVDALNRRPDRPWTEMRKGKEINDLWLAHQLRPYGIRPKTIWIGDEHAKGYLEEDFTDAFRRYIPKNEIESLCADWAADQPGAPNPKGIA